MKIDWKKDGLSLLVLLMILVSIGWEHYERNNLGSIMNAVCLEGLRVAEIQHRMTLFQIETLARDEKKAPKMILADIAILAHKAQANPSEMSQAIDHFADCNKLKR